MKQQNRIMAWLLALFLLTGCGAQPAALVIVPDVVGTTATMAQDTLSQAGLVPVVKPIYDTAEPIDTVLSTDPPAGSHAAPGSKVFVFVSADRTTTDTTTQTAAVSDTTARSSSTTHTTAASQTAKPSTNPSPSATRSTTTSATLTTTTTTQTSLTATSQTSPAVTDPCANGHAYVSGVCSRCGAKDTAYVEVFTCEQTWTVENQWEFSVTSVTVHHLCSNSLNQAEGYTDQQVVTIRYTYKNIGYTNDYNDLMLNEMAFAVYDERGETASTYACRHKQPAQPLAPGESCTAEAVYVLNNHSDHLQLTVRFLPSNGHGVQRAQFDLPIT